MQSIAGHHHLSDRPEGGVHPGAELVQGDLLNVFGAPSQRTLGKSDHRPRHLDRGLHKQVAQLGELAVAGPGPPGPDSARGGHHGLVGPEVLPQAGENVPRRRPALGGLPGRGHGSEQPVPGMVLQLDQPSSHPALCLDPPGQLGVQGATLASIRHPRLTRQSCHRNR